MENTIAAISTANGIGGMGVIRISGENACRVAQNVFKSVSDKNITQMKMIPIVKRMTGSVLPAAMAFTMFVGTMLRRKLETVGVVMLPVYSGAFSNTVPFPHSRVNLPKELSSTVKWDLQKPKLLWI